MLLDEMDCVAMTDANGKYIYQNRLWHERRRELGQDPGIEYPWLLLEGSAVPEVLRTRKKKIGHLMQSGNTTICVNYYPITKGEEFFGVLIWTIFTGMSTVQTFADQVGRLTQELKQARKTNRTLAAASYGISNIVGNSNAILELKEQIAQVARTNSNVLILGETGVGKELVAHAIHDLSSRKEKRFVRVNCSAIPRDLMEVEFFGYEPGSFTGAKKQGKTGKFELASDGSLFLDEVNLLPLEMQPKLLRVLQEREIERIGGTRTIPVNTRIIAATNCDLMKQVRGGDFREDLYYRLNVVNVTVPPLRERKEDIPLLVRSMVAKLSYQMGLAVSYVCDDAISFLMEYDWPGNIRELQNAVEQAMNYTGEDTIELRHVEEYFKRLHGRLPASAVQTPQNSGDSRFSVARHAANEDLGYTLAANRKRSERETILAALERCGGNRSNAAKHLGIARSTFYRKLQEFNLSGTN